MTHKNFLDATLASIGFAGAAAHAFQISETGRFRKVAEGAGIKPE